VIACLYHQVLFNFFGSFLRGSQVASDQVLRRTLQEVDQWGYFLVWLLALWRCHHSNVFLVQNCSKFCLPELIPGWYNRTNSVLVLIGMI